MNCKTVLNTIIHGAHESRILIDVSNHTLKMYRKNLTIVEMEDEDSIYIYDEKRNNEYLIHTPAVKSIRVLGGRE